MSKTIQATVQCKAGSASQWAALDPVLLEGEIGVDISATPHKLKVGDGVSRWSQLEFIGGESTKIEIADNLQTLDPTKALSARQGYILDQTKMAENTPFKTINGQSVRGHGNIVVGGETQPITIVDSLESTDPDAALSANQGHVLKGICDDLGSAIIGCATQHEMTEVRNTLATKAATTYVDDVVGQLPDVDDYVAVDAKADEALAGIDTLEGSIDDLGNTLSSQIVRLDATDEALDARIIAAYARIETAEQTVADAVDIAQAAAAAVESKLSREEADAIYETQAHAAATYLTEHQHLKTINNISLIGSGNIDIQGGGPDPIPIDTEFTDSPSDSHVPSSRLVKTSLDAKADTAALADYATKAEIAGKADTTYVDTQLAAKADTSYVNAQLDTKATVLYVDTQLAGKADKAEIPTLTSQLTNDSGFITDSDIPEEVFIATPDTTSPLECLMAHNAGKVVLLKTRVDYENLTLRLVKRQDGFLLFACSVGSRAFSLIVHEMTETPTWPSVDVTILAQASDVAAKADKTYVDTQLALKADTTYVDTQLAGKADVDAIPTLTSDLTNDSGFITQADTIFNVEYGITTLAQIDAALAGGKQPYIRVPKEVTFQEDDAYGYLSMNAEAGAIYTFECTMASTLGSSMYPSIDSSGVWGISYSFTKPLLAVMTSNIAGKADTTYVDAGLATKADISSLDVYATKAELALKSDTTYVDAQVATKQDTLIPGVGIVIGSDGKTISRSSYQSFAYGTATYSEINSAVQHGIAIVLSGLPSEIPHSGNVLVSPRFEQKTMGGNGYYFDIHALNDTDYTRGWRVHISGNGWSYEAFDNTATCNAYTDTQVATKADTTYVDTQLATKAALADVYSILASKRVVYVATADPLPQITASYFNAHAQGSIGLSNAPQSFRLVPKQGGDGVVYAFALFVPDGIEVGTLRWWADSARTDLPTSRGIDVGDPTETSTNVTTNFGHGKILKWNIYNGYSDLIKMGESFSVDSVTLED